MYNNLTETNYWSNIMSDWMIGWFFTFLPIFLLIVGVFLPYDYTMVSALKTIKAREEIERLDALSKQIDTFLADLNADPSKIKRVKFGTTINVGTSKIDRSTFGTMIRD